MKATSESKGELMAEINMIPFIDVALVLLIIFMVMTPFLVKSQVKVDLPKSSTTDHAPDKKDQTVTVQVQKTGAIFIDGQPIPADQLENALKSRVSEPESQPVMIEADREVSFQHVVTVMSAAKKLGITKLGVGVVEEKDRKTTGSRSSR